MTRVCRVNADFETPFATRFVECRRSFARRLLKLRVALMQPHEEETHPRGRRIFSRRSGNRVRDCLLRRSYFPRRVFLSTKRFGFAIWSGLENFRIIFGTLSLSYGISNGSCSV